MQRAIRKGSYPSVHGWVFDMYTGYIKDLVLPLDMWKEKGFVEPRYIHTL